MRRAVLLLTIIGISGCSSLPAMNGESRRQSALNADVLLGSDRASLFESYVKKIEEAHAFRNSNFARLSTTWKRELERPRRRFLEARSDEDTYYALVSLLNSVRDAHTWVNFPKELDVRRPSQMLPVRFAPIKVGGEWKFIVFKSEDERIQVGDSFVELDGKADRELISEFREWYSGNSPDNLIWETARWLTLRNPHESPSPRAGSSVILKVRRQGEKEIGIPLTWRDWKRPGYDPCFSDGPEQLDYDGYQVSFRGINYCVYSLPHKIEVVRYSSFIYDLASRDDLRKGFPSFPTKKT